MGTYRFHCVVGLALAAALLAPAPRAGAAVYHESFDATTNDHTIATLNAYPGYAGRFVVDGGAMVAGGQLRLVNGSHDDEQSLVRPGVAGPATVSALVGADNSGGSYNVGIGIGQNNIVFHPGFGGAGLHVEGTGGFANTNVGFTPANGVLHQLDVAYSAAGVFNITLTDGANPANTWSGSFTNAASVGGEIALRRSGGPVGVGLYDDLTVNGVTESFDTSTNVGRSAVYTPALVTGSVSVNAGQLVLDSTADNAQTLLRSGLKRDHTIIAKLGADNSNGSYNVGLRVGENDIVFHPGYGGAGLRVEGPGGFDNTNVGFTPGNNVLHELEVESDGFGTFQVTLTDGANPANTFTASFTNPDSVGGDFGPRRSGGATGMGFYDSITVDVAKPNQGVIQAELFDRGADMPLTYPALGQRELGGGKAFVQGGTLVLAPPTSGANMYVNHPGLSGAGTISTRAGADDSGGSFNVGLRIGDNQVVFHPGFGGGGLRVEGPGGFGNMDVGFKPANGVLHELRVDSDGAGLFDITFTDGANPANVWTGSWTNAAAVGAQVSLVRKGPTYGTGLFDDFTVGAAVESFSVSTDAQALYPGFAATLNGGYATANNGVLELRPRRDTNTFQTFLTSGFPDKFEMTGLVGAEVGGGSYNVGFTVGENDIVFHPGLSGGLLRVEGPGGFWNTDVGFTPAAGVLHLLRVESDGTGHFDITLVDGDDPSHVFTASFFNPGSVGGEMGFRRSGEANGAGLFDNLIITAVPEPVSVATVLLGLSGLGLWVRRRRK